MRLACGALALSSLVGPGSSLMATDRLLANSMDLGAASADSADAALLLEGANAGVTAGSPSLMEFGRSESWKALDARSSSNSDDWASSAHSVSNAAAAAASASQAVVGAAERIGSAP